MARRSNILITGPLPPPAGGISIHISRLKSLIKDDFNLDFIDESSIIKSEFYNIRSFNPVPYIKKMIAADLLYIHSGSNLLKKMHIVIGKLLRKKIIITIHGYKKKKRFPFRFIDSKIYTLADKIILVNPDMIEKISLPIDKCIVKHAFLPPSMSEEAVLPKLVIERIAKARLNNEIIICANASRLDTYNNEDLYGLDICLEVTSKLINKKKLICFIFNVSSLENGAERYYQAQELIERLSLEDSFLLLNENLSFVKLIEKSNIVLRPTNTDGDAITIRESIFLGKKVLASDIVSRPIGTFLFKSRDVDDLELQLNKLINNNKNLIKINTESDTNDCKSFYSTIINEHLTINRNKKSLYDNR